LVTNQILLVLFACHKAKLGVYFCAMNIIVRLSFVLGFVFGFFSASGQSNSNQSLVSDSVFVKHIFILGNIKTKERIILRELSFRAGQKLPVKGLEERLQRDNNLIFNTQLFTFSSIQFQAYRGDTIAVFIEVNEEWYFWPIPIVEVGDRSVNEWWSNRGGGFSRLNYGLDLRLDNFRGQRDQLKLRANFGFTNRINIFYQYPYINQKQTLGLKFELQYRESKFVQYGTGEFKDRLNSLLEIKGEQVLLSSYKFNQLLVYRPNFYNFHEFGLGYIWERIADTVASLNPEFLLDGRTQMGYLSLSYAFRYDKRDVQQYPLQGYFLGLTFNQKGIGSWDAIRQSELRLEAQKFWRLSQFFFLSTSHRTKLSTPSRQPYLETRSLGYREDYIRGFDLYVIEGQHFYLNRNTFRFKWLDKNLGMQKLVPIRQFNKIPFKILSKTYFDIGYVRNEFSQPTNGPLYNQTLWGYGFGIDFVSAYERVMRIEYSRNNFGEGRFYFSFNADF
jgi:outer membrane protein assembly factor BamA